MRAGRLHIALDSVGLRSNSPRLFPMKARVLVLPKQSILDPQGVAVRDALAHHGLPAVQSARVGKVIDLEFATPPSEADLHAACRDLLSNPVIEDYQLVLE